MSTRRGFISSLTATVAGLVLGKKLPAITPNIQSVTVPFEGTTGPYRFDVLYGTKLIRPEFACRIVDGPAYAKEAEIAAAITKQLETKTAPRLTEVIRAEHRRENRFLFNKGKEFILMDEDVDPERMIARVDMATDIDLLTVSHEVK